MSSANEAESSVPQSFDHLQALRRRNVAARQGAVLDALQSGGEAAPLTLKVSDDPREQDFESYSWWASTMLGVVALELTLGLAAFLYEVFEPELPATDSFKTLVKPGLAKAYTACLYGAYATWLASFADLATQAPRWWAAARKHGFFKLLGAGTVTEGGAAPLGVWRVLDTAVVAGLAVVLAREADTAFRLLSVVRLGVRTVELLGLLSSRARAVVKACEARVITEREMTESLAAQNEQLQVRWRRETETRTRYEELLQEYRGEIETLREALLLAAQDMADLETNGGAGGASEAGSTASSPLQPAGGRGPSRVGSMRLGSGDIAKIVADSAAAAGAGEAASAQHHHHHHPARGPRIGGGVAGAGRASVGSGSDGRSHRSGGAVGGVSARFTIHKDGSATVTGSGGGAGAQ